VTSAEEQGRLEAAYAKRTADDPRYSLSDPAYRLAYEEREREVLRLLAAALPGPLAGHRILDIGCGNGGWLADLVRWGADPAKVVGVDPLPTRVERARGSVAAGVRVELANGTALPFPDRSFDIGLLSTVVSSIADREVARQVAREARRVVRPGGVILWYDFFVGNPRNPDVRGVGRAEIAELFPGAELRLRRFTLAPPLARLVAPRSLPLARLLATIPFLRTHYLGVIRI
jgi:SAM-dependent methyltransferase